VIDTVSRFDPRLARLRQENSSQFLGTVPEAINHAPEAIHPPVDRSPQFSLTGSQARYRLNVNLGAELMDGHAAHHLLPWEGRYLESTRRAYEAAARGGWNINGAENGMLLPQRYHKDDHPIYSGRVLDHIESLWIEHRGPNGQTTRSDIEWAEIFRGLARDLAQGIRNDYHLGNYDPHMRVCRWLGTSVQ